MIDILNYIYYYPLVMEFLANPYNLLLDFVELRADIGFDKYYETSEKYLSSTRD